ncbi:hypothetical protein LMG26696_03581 [Achromobacter pulmonis]|uniref:hypothetical protein n=1 Tax=Achromobacter pulmonis TaxID=1389932 RepID=UPI0014663C57|nr:hypothetical protein [Achromobacter pulmonis]CAB3665146.1 hypothetical protein LMG26696_03581 [Achromobacter pulmonis]
MTTKLSVDAAFERDIPAEHRDDVMQMICETAQYGDDYHPQHVSILDRDRIDAINVRAEGVLTFQGREFAFIVRDGNWDGTVLEGWEEAGTQTFEPLPRTEWTLAPQPSLVSDAIANGKGPFLVAKWDAFIQRPEIAKITGSYTYDRMVQPGLKVEQYWKAQAAKHQFIITDKENADDIRARLLAARGAQ